MTSKRISISLAEPAVAAVPAPAVKRIFNPLDSVVASSESDEFTSLSRIINSDVGVCPKCGKAMGTAIIANNDTVFYCEADRVSTPMPNKTGC